MPRWHARHPSKWSSCELAASRARTVTNETHIRSSACVFSDYAIANVVNSMRSCSLHMHGCRRQLSSTACDMTEMCAHMTSNVQHNYATMKCNDGSLGPRGVPPGDELALAMHEVVWYYGAVITLFPYRDIMYCRLSFPICYMYFCTLSIVVGADSRTMHYTARHQANVCDVQLNCTRIGNGCQQDAEESIRSEDAARWALILASIGLIW